MPDPDDHLRILVANERSDRLELLAGVVEGLGHEVVARTVSVAGVAAITAKERPDVALVGLGEDSAHASELVTEIVREAYCPVIAILHGHDVSWVSDAAKIGLYAYIVNGEPDELQSAIDITLGRFREVQSLQHSIEHRAREAQREKDHASARQEQALELHDGVVQGLVETQLALEFGREDESAASLAETLERAKAVVSRSLEELREAGVSTDQLIRKSTTGTEDG